MAAQPNILMVMADQLSAAALGAYGHPVVRTPNVDRLAEAGVRFDRAYCNAPLCVPARAAMLTGRLPSRIGSFDNACELPAQIPTFLHHLRRAGYRTLASGKLHLIGPDQLHGFERRLTPDIYPAGFDWTPDWRAGVVRNPGTSAEKLRRSGVVESNEQITYDENVHAQALRGLRALATEPDRPFFLCVSYSHPHDPFQTTQPYWDRYDPDTIDEPAVPAVPLETLHPYNRWIQQHHCVDEFPPSPEVLRDSRRAYYGMVSYWDDKVGALLAELERLGLADDTAILVLSDHGEMLGEHGMWFKRTFYERAVRVPLIAAWPGRWAAGRCIDEVVSLVDLFPTVLELADPPGRDEVAGELDGDSLAPLLEGRGAERERPAVFEYCGEGALHPMRAIVRGRHKYVHVHSQEPLLFDLASDPHEQINLRGRPETGSLEARLREELLADWDAAETERRVLDSQRDRKLILEAQSRGRHEPWDYRPSSDPLS
jgi:choline-sulfatase